MVDSPLWWAGFIWVLFCGWALSSYTSNLIFRLPRKEYPFGREPYCGDCNASLTPRELFPIFSFWLTDGKCRHCGSIIPFSYFVIEVFFPLAYIAAYVKFGLADEFILVALAVPCLFAIAMMAWEENYFSPMTTLMLGVVGLWMQTLTQHSITTGLVGGFIGFIAAVALHRFNQKTPQVAPDLREFPSYIWLAGAMGCWLPMDALWMALPVWLLLQNILQRSILIKRKPYISEAISFALVLTAGIFRCY